MREYTHIPLDEEVRSIGGHYVLEKEVRLPFNGREVLYVVGMGVVDTSCCGITGCRYAIVPGYILGWKTRRNRDNLEVSEVESIRSEETKRILTEQIKKNDVVQHVEFH
ncbi:MAG: hypothetical protein C4520_11105 [Candidatus Abyssobacteria bacterium SURF_5]|uniref:Uncharacterized protein n=1 Tax=Abyssobacteria bacterium (strain SURF_5) TaxID=2093360 RepID=A0A3A4NRK7_ABYX5|nr:MAG: hypothetical protein C4520_11105 [Candidatus Abyssubacteria bacterium SURF_5]